MEQHQIEIESLLNDPGSSAEEFMAKIRRFSATQLKTILDAATQDPWRTAVPSFVLQILVNEMAERTREETRKKILEAAGSVELSVLRSKLPFCHDYTDSDGNIDPDHFPRSRAETILDFDQVQNIPESVWKGIINIRDETISVHSENSVVFYLTTLYRGIIKAAGLENKMDVIVTRMIAGNECDIVLVAKETFQPLSVTEIKKPHSAENDEKIFLLTAGNRRRSARLGQEDKSKTIGQHFDQLHNVKWMTGLKKVYGMISTGNSFMITCTDSLAGNAELVIPPGIFASETEQDGGNGECRVSPTKPKLFDNEESETAPEYSPPDAEERLHTSQVITITEDGSRDAPSRQIVNMLILQTARAMECLQNLDVSNTMLPVQGTVFSRQIDLKKNDARTTDKQCYTQITLKKGWQRCRKNYIDSTVRAVNLIRSVGSGASGDCCFAVSTDQQKSCVIKFFQAARNTTTLEQAKKEKKNWDRAYGTTCFETLVVTLGGERGCLAMPYVDIVGVDRDACLRDGEKELRECLHRFSCGNSETGRFLLHRDVKWRHLGYLQDKLTLVDLGSVEETQDKTEWVEWMDRCVNGLVNSNSQGRGKRARRWY